MASGERFEAAKMKKKCVASARVLCEMTAGRNRGSNRGCEETSEKAIESEGQGERGDVGRQALQEQGVGSLDLYRSHVTRKRKRVGKRVQQEARVEAGHGGGQKSVLEEFTLKRRRREERIDG